MARIKGPLLSMSASGQIGKTLVSSTWRGIPYMRQHVVPSNPRSTAQTLTRNTFSSLDDQFKRMLALAQAPWTANARGRGYTNRNAFIRDNLPDIRGEADMANFVGSPGVAGGLPGLDPTAVGGAGSGEIDATLDIGEGPVDWENPSVTFLAFLDRDPTVLMTSFVVEASETGGEDVWVAPLTVSHTFTGLEAGQLYIVSMFPIWTRADGTTAYGPSSTLTATATV